MQQTRPQLAERPEEAGKRHDANFFSLMNVGLDGDEYVTAELNDQQLKEITRQVRRDLSTVVLFLLSQ